MYLLTLGRHRHEVGHKLQPELVRGHRPKRLLPQGGQQHSCLSIGNQSLHLVPLLQHIGIIALTQAQVQQSGQVVGTQPVIGDAACIRQHIVPGVHRKVALLLGLLHGLVHHIEPPGHTQHQGVIKLYLIQKMVIVVGQYNLLA